MEIKEEKYIEEIKCPNCRDREVHDISKGVRIKEYKEKTKCNKCGCYLDWS